MARAFGSYPKCHRFESSCRYHKNYPVWVIYILYPRPVGQAVKTPPFHGGNAGSIPARVTKKSGHLLWQVSFFLPFCPLRPRFARPPLPEGEARGRVVEVHLSAFTLGERIMLSAKRCRCRRLRVCCSWRRKGRASSHPNPSKRSFTERSRSLWNTAALYLPQKNMPKTAGLKNGSMPICSRTGTTRLFRMD